MIRYHFDLYPRADPKNGVRLVRFTKLQSAEYRGEANGTGSGRFSIRADTAEAQNIDPAGLQYVRVVREDTVAATEAVVGGFFLDSGDFTALDERGTRLLTFGGAGTLSYLARAIMASHTYISPIFTGQDPIAGVWNLWNQSTFYANGNYLGAMLWRVLYEATHFTPGSHRHADGVIYTDTHADDRPENALPDLTLGFDAFNDSNAAAWAVTSGEFKAQVGENVLQVVKRLMEAGLYVEMNPDTFELDAYPASGHRRTRTGASWGPTVVRFQAPTGGDIDTGNIKSDAKRAIAAFIKRSWLLAGSNDTYGDATGTSDIPWEGFYHSDTADATALAGIAGVQTGARDDAGDTARLRIRLGTDTSSGYYRPFEDVRLDDLVTVHTGTTQWDWNEQNFPVAAITVTLRAGGDWDAWVELGSSYSATPGRQFQVSPVAAHNHPPNPELCRPGVIGSPADSTGVWGWVTSGGFPNTGPAIHDDDLNTGLQSDSWNLTPYWMTDYGLGNQGTIGTFRVYHKRGTFPHLSPSSIELRGSDTNDWTTAPVLGSASVAAADGWTEITVTPSTARYFYMVNTGGTPGGAGALDGWYVVEIETDDGGGTSTVIGDGHPDLVGTSPRAARCDHRHDVHRDTAPTVNDDWASDGYKLGTIWAQLDSLASPTEIVATWLLVDNSAGAAIWLPFSAGLSEAAIQALIDASVDTHEAAADPHTGYVREADANWVDLTDGGQTTLHTHASSIPTGYYRPVMDGLGNVVTDSGTGAALMAYAED